MPKGIVVYTDDGSIIRWRPPYAERLNEGANELEADIDPSELDKYEVDVSASEDELVRAEATAEQRFRDARESGNPQDQLDALFEILTGEQP